MMTSSTATRVPNIDVPLDLLHRILDDCLRVLSADRCGLFLKDPDEGDFRLITSIGLSEAYLSATLDRQVGFPNSQMLQEPRFLYYPDAQCDSRLKEFWSQIRDEGIRSVISVPLPSEEQPIGVLLLYFDQPRGISPEDTRTIRTFADLAAIAIENRRLYEREKEASRRLDRLQELALQVSSSLDIEEVLSAITKATVEQLGGSHSRIYLLDEEERFLRCRAYCGVPPGSVGDLPGMEPGMGLAGWVFEHAEAAIVGDVQKDPRWLDLSWAEAQGLHSFIGVPLRLSGQVLGLINCLSRGLNQFTESDLRLLESLAGHAVVAIEKARAFKGVKTRSDRQEALRKVTGDITRHLDLPALFRRICEGVCELLDVEFGRVFVLEESAGIFRLAGHFNRIEKNYQPVSAIPMGIGIVSRIYVERAPVIVPDIRKGANWYKPEGIERLGVRSFVGVPLILRNRVVGVLHCYTTGSREFRSDEIELLRDFADQAAVALENARLFHETEERATKLEILAEITKAVNATLDLKELFRVTVEQVKRVIPCERCSVYKVEPDKQVISRIYAVDDVEERVNRIPPSSLKGSEFEHVLETLNARYIPDTRKDRHPRIQFLAAEGLSSVITVPILSEGDCIGFLNISSEKADAFATEQINLLGSVADHLAPAMKNAELYARAKESGERLDNFVRGASDGIITVDLEGRITSWNPGAEVMYGYSEKEMLGQDFQRVFPQAAQEERERWVSMKSGKTVSAFETVRRRKDGTPVEISLTLSPIQNAEGRLVGISGIQMDITERKRAEEALKLTQFSVERTADPVFWVGADSRILNVNDATCRHLGYSREELLSMRISDINPAFPPERWTEYWEEVKRKGSLTFESSQRRKDGSEVPVEVATNYMEFNGKEYDFAFVRDITERKRAEDALRESEGKGRTLLAAVPDLLLRIKGDGTFLECKGAENFDTYVPPDQFLGKNVRDILPTDTGERIMAKIQNALQTGKAQVFEYPLLENGETRNYESRIVVSGQDDVLALVRDITERKRTEDALRNSEARNRAILEAAPDGILTFDKSGVIDSFNPAAERIFGLSAPEVLDGKIGTLMDGDDAPRFEAYLQWYLQTGENEVFSLSREVIGRRKDGSTFPMNMTVSEMRLEGRRIFTGIIRDLTDHKAVENRIHQAERMESTGILARGIAHDFGNLLTSIQANLMLALTEMKPADPGFIHLSRLSQAANRAAELVTRLRALGRDLPIQKRRVNLNKELQTVLDLLPAIIPDSIEVEIQPCREICTSQADPVFLQDMLINLCLNAKDAMPDGGRLSVGIERLLLEAGHPDLGRDMAPGAYDCISVRDSGKGMTQAVRDKIFEPFFTTKGSSKGTGLGLPMVQRIVKEHNGFINIETKPGEGTTFWVYLPVPRPEPAGPDFPGADRLASGKGERILLIDDDLLVLDVIEEMLSACGYEVTTATCGREGVQLFSEAPERINLVLTDVVMPDFSGREVFHRIRKMRGDVKVLFSSGNQVELPEAVEENGAAFIQKPYSLSELLKGIRQMLDRP